ncbi:MAG: indolepyruvate oxidoreductase subunit beta [Firmicutes bacterium]|nr:indolepyruvate oxidoreductase subunit beta [Bacillota bacterium]
MKIDIVIAGVGGQGNVLMSRILARAAMEAGLAVRTSEVIGMAQRGGPVTSQVRMGDALYGGLIPDRQADIILGLELAETVRVLPKLKPGGRVITSSTSLVPVSVAVGLSTYDREALLQYLQTMTSRPVIFDAVSLALQVGNARAANVVLLGALSTLPVLPFSPETLMRCCLESIPAQFQSINQKAFELGRRIMEVD